VKLVPELTRAKRLENLIQKFEECQSGNFSIDNRSLCF
jgi:hypothetical protein